MDEHDLNNSDDDGDHDSKACAHCQRPLDLGVDVLSVEEGVIGPRGIVPLNDRRFFCSDECLARHFGDLDADRKREHMPRRIP